MRGPRINIVNSNLDPLVYKFSIISRLDTLEYKVREITAMIREDFPVEVVARLAILAGTLTRSSTPLFPLLYLICFTTSLPTDHVYKPRYYEAYLSRSLRSARLRYAFSPSLFILLTHNYISLLHSIRYTI
jgi:hypothetical protein